MSANRKLWTAPIGVSLIDRAIDRASSEPSSLWLVPSPLAKEQIFERLAVRWKGVDPPKVWTSDDAWFATARDQPDCPARLSNAAILIVLEAAIERTRRDGRLELLEAAVRFPGYRRQLLTRFDDWSRSEWPMDGPRPDSSPVGLEEFALYGQYRATLYDLNAEDAEGWSAWMSRALLRQPPPELRKLGQVVVVDPTHAGKSTGRLLDHCRKSARSMVVTLPYDSDPSFAELHSVTGQVRQKFLDWGFVEETEEVGGFHFRRPGLLAIERDLFRSDSLRPPSIKLKSDSGLKILGGPKGDGVALLVAREVRRALNRGVEREEILILSPRIDEDSERVRETLLAWNIPVDPGHARKLSTVPAISALRLAMRLPVEGWEVSTLLRLLRNGRIGWGKLDEASPFARFEAASSIHLTRVFRDRDSLMDALRRAISDPKSRNSHAATALRVLESLAAKIDSVVGRGNWRDLVARTRRLAGLLTLDFDELGPLWDALEDQGWVRSKLGPSIAEESWTWAEFVAQVDATVVAIEIPRPDPEPGTIRIETVSNVEGARAKVVILTNLAEQSFPSADAINLDAPSDRANLAYAHEMLRFAQVSGSADEELILAFPTSDQTGQKHLPAGFLDDLMRRLEGGESSPCIEKHNRFDPVLIGHADLVQSPADARVLAVALACQGNDFTSLESLANRPEHAEPLRGTADAFAVAHRRRHESAFGLYDGRLHDPQAIASIREKFGPEYTFSPSQLESFALCPFQFYQRYVLGLKVVDERQELDEDYAGRGDDVHRVLEQIHQQAIAEGTSNLIDRLTILIETQMRVELEQHDTQFVDVARVLKEIGTRRTNKALGRYVGQFRSYAANAGKGSQPHLFEVGFGVKDDRDDDPQTLPDLTIGEGEHSLRLQGKIDRIDLVHHDGEIKFRVIDYKTGANPSGTDVKKGLASQLPLYALAVEKLVFPEGDRPLEDFGYWSLRNDGFKHVKLGDDWKDYRDLLMEFVLGLVAHIRRGTFPIESGKKDCRSHCDYQAVCRVSEVRMVGKTWTERPTLGADE